MNRDERRQRTKLKVNQRVRQWKEFHDEEPDPKRRGRGKQRSPFDCGNADCYCSEPDAYRDRNWDDVNDLSASTSLSFLDDEPDL